MAWRFLFVFSYEIAVAIPADLLYRYVVKLLCAMGLLTSKKIKMETIESMIKRGIRDCLLKPYNSDLLSPADKRNKSKLISRESLDELVHCLIAYAESGAKNYSDHVKINGDYNHSLTCATDDIINDFVHNGLIITWYNTAIPRIEILDQRPLKKYNVSILYGFIYYPYKAVNFWDCKEYKVDVSKITPYAITKYTKVRDIFTACQQAHKGGEFRCIIASENSKLCRLFVNNFINKIGKI